MKIIISTSIILTGLLSVMTCTPQREFSMGGFAAKAKGTMYVNNEDPIPHLSRIIVFTGVHDSRINRQILDEFNSLNIKAVNGLDAFSPVKQYTDSDFQDFLRENNIDGVIRVELKHRSAYEGMMRTEIELSLLDPTSNMTIAAFFGEGLSLINEPDRAVLKFFQAAVRELKPILTRQSRVDN